MKRFYASKSTFSYLYPFIRYGGNKKTKNLIKMSLNLNLKKTIYWIFTKISGNIFYIILNIHANF